MTRWGLLLINLGTPDSTSVPDVRRYLEEFLSDPRVIDLSPLGRWLLLNFAILPHRPQRSAHAYEQIWTPEGSPLLIAGERLAAKVRARLGDDVPVALAMRYGNPSIAAGLGELRETGVDRVVVFPLFPQNSSAAWGSAVEKAFAVAAEMWKVPALSVVPPFYAEPEYLAAQVAVAHPALETARPDHVLFSFHGVPERHCRKGDPSGSHCLVRADCCERIVAANRDCYRAQCFATGRSLAAELGLADGTWEVVFQSRLGRDPWIRPYMDARVRELAEQGVKRVAVLSPAFVADCLETLEEIGIRAAADFHAHGGEDLSLIPSLNDSAPWADAVVALATRPLQSRPATGEAQSA